MTSPTKPMLSILVESHPALPDGICLRYKAETQPRPILAVHYAPEDGPEGWWDATAAHASGEVTSAWGAEVEDSGAGTSLLVWGGDHGLRLHLGGQNVAETHLLLDPQDVRWGGVAGRP